jgi:HAD superfamily hydrolase (TIGR01509 family)
MGMLRAVIFDMDGVIVDSEPLHIAAEKETLGLYGIFPSTEELQAYMGRKMRPVLEDMIRNYRLPLSLDDLLSAHTTRLLGHYRRSVRPIPGALSLIRELHRGGIPLALASSSGRDLVDVVTGRFGLDRYFSVIASGEAVENSKPHPDIFMAVVAQLKVAASECAVIEDSQAGVAAAVSAGTYCVGFESPNSQNQDLSRAHWIVDDLRKVTLETLRARMEAPA